MANNIRTRQIGESGRNGSGRVEVSVMMFLEPAGVERILQELRRRQLTVHHLRARREGSTIHIWLQVDRKDEQAVRQFMAGIREAQTMREAV